jgi:hypothetical protein
MFIGMVIAYLRAESCTPSFNIVLVIAITTKAEHINK